MFEKGLFGGFFDFNHDGKMDSFEKAAEFAAFMHLMDESKEDSNENISSECNFFVSDSDESVDTVDEIDDALAGIGLDIVDLELMDEEERIEALEDAGLDPYDFDLDLF